MTPPQQALLQKKTRVNLIRTLQDFSDRQRQENYKRAVPFVHVPRELLAQWDDFSRLLNERQDWFVNSLRASEIAAMEAFDAQIASFSVDERLPDVPQILEVSDWVRLMHGASQLLIALNHVGCEPNAEGSSK